MVSSQNTADSVAWAKASIGQVGIDLLQAEVKGKSKHSFCLTKLFFCGWLVEKVLRDEKLVQVRIKVNLVAIPLAIVPEVAIAMPI